ncbi:MAG: ComEC/Rec2 family competence protein, partial [Longimicrobiales bacterium]
AGTGGTLDIHAIDVGQGDALAIRSPAGRWIVVDTGIRSDDYDAGRSRVVPFLRQHGVRRVDILILTHPHADHIGGTIALLDAFDVGVIIDPAVAAGSEVYAETLGRARRLGVRWVAARPGREIALGDVVIQVLAPLENVLDASADPNDYSAVFRLAYGRFGALFLGDAPMEVENELVARHGAALAAQLLKVGHHGSLTSTGDSLLAAIRPSLAIVSAGRRNRYGHPHARVLARLAGHGVRVLRTDERGTISVRVDARGEMTATSTR